MSKFCFGFSTHLPLPRTLTLSAGGASATVRLRSDGTIGLRPLQRAIERLSQSPIVWDSIPGLILRRCHCGQTYAVDLTIAEREARAAGTVSGKRLWGLK